MTRSTCVRRAWSPRPHGRRLAACCAPPAPPAAPARTLLGYSAPASAAELALEQRFQAGVTADSMSALHRPLTERPHPAGSEGTRQVVAYLQKTLAGFGLDVQTHEYQVLLDRPRKVEIALTAPTRRVLERAGAGDRRRPDVVTPRAGRRLHRLFGLGHGLRARWCSSTTACRPTTRELSPSRRVGEGPHRHRPLRPEPPRGEGAHRPGTRRPRARALQRSGRRRLGQGAGVARRLLARPATCCSAATPS